MSKASETRRVLEDARDLLYGHWCQGNYAIDADGNPCGTKSERAVGFDLVAAVHRVAPDIRTANRATAALKRVGPDMGLAQWNDTATLDDVLELYADAIEAV